jgi:hypothetical protein
MLWKLTTVVGLILLLLVPALSEDQPAQPLGIPTPPGATVTMELNMGRDQMVGQLAMLTAGIESSSSGAIKISPAELQEALGGLESAQYMEMQLPAKYRASDILSLFQKEVGGRRVLYDVSKSDSVRLLLATDGGGYFGALIDAAKDKKGKITSGRIRAARLYGFLDARKSARIAMPILLQMGVSSTRVLITK